MKQTHFNFHKIVSPKVIVTHKFCPVCNQNKPITEFYKMAASKDCHAGKCKKCQAAYSVERHKRLSQDPAYRKALCDKVKQYQKANPEKTRATRRTATKTYMRNNPIARWKRGLQRKWRDKYHTTARLGATISEITQHISSLLTEEMTWQNYGIVWCISRINSVSEFQDINQANHYTNFRPKRLNQPHNT